MRRRHHRQVRELLEGARPHRPISGPTLDRDSVDEQWQRILSEVEHQARPREARAVPTIPVRRKVAATTRRVVIPVGIAAAVLTLLGTVLVVVAPGSAVALEPFPDRCTDFLRQTKPDHVVVAAVWGGEERRRFRQVLERFEASTGIEVTLAASDPDPDRDIGTTIENLIQRNCAPDVVLLPQPGLLKDLASEGKLQPVGDAIEALVDANYMPVWRDLARGDDGVLYGVWFRAANKSMIWYNARAFARAQVQPPGNWDELLAVAGKLRAARFTPFSIAGADEAGWTLTDWFENIYLRRAGPEKYDQLARHDIAWTDPTVIDALQLFSEILSQRQWLAGGPAGAADTTYEESVQDVFGNLDRPEAAMVFEADFVANEVAKTDAKLGVDARFFPFPSIGDWRPTLVGAGEQATRGEVGGDVAVLLRDRDEGRRLLEYLGNPRAAEPWVQAGGFLSPNKAVDLSIYPDPTTREAARALRDAKTVRFDLSDLQRPEFGSTPGQGMWEIFQDFLRDPGQVGRTAEKLERCWSAPPSQAKTCHGS
jgi:alpha-glucoside transport system substrate-binding protein